MCRQAGLIFAGTAAQIRNLPDYRTEVLFREIRALKGVEADSVALVLIGGVVGERQVTGDQFMFHVGRRYIVFAWDSGSRGNSYMPVMGFGLFRVSTDPRTRREIVYNCIGNPLVRFSADQAVEMWPDSAYRPAIRERLAKEHRETARKRSEEEKRGPWLTLWELEDPGTRVTEDEFIAVVQATLKEQGRDGR